MKALTIKVEKKSIKTVNTIEVPKKKHFSLMASLAQKNHAPFARFYHDKKHDSVKSAESKDVKKAKALNLFREKKDSAVHTPLILSSVQLLDEHLNDQLNQTLHQIDMHHKDKKMVAAEVKKTVAPKHETKTTAAVEVA